MCVYAIILTYLCTCICLHIHILLVLVTELCTYQGTKHTHTYIRVYMHICRYIIRIAYNAQTWEPHLHMKLLLFSLAINTLYTFDYCMPYNLYYFPLHKLIITNKAVIFVCVGVCVALMSSLLLLLFLDYRFNKKTTTTKKLIFYILFLSC